VLFGGLPSFLVFVLGIPTMFYALLSHARNFAVQPLLERIYAVRVRHTSHAHVHSTHTHTEGHTYACIN
jgi:hypothetical protein